MNPTVKKIWTDALRSGKYKQTRYLLKVKENGEWGYCCLGVLCEEAAKAGVKLEVQETVKPDRVEVSFDYAFTSLPDSVMKWAGLTSPTPRIGDQSAIGLNDQEGKTFDQIADLIDQHL